MRRHSENNEEASNSSKIVTKEKVVVPTRVDGCIDQVEYMRCMESLLKEVKKPPCRQDINNIGRLLALTYDERRNKINSALVQTTALTEEYPFFKTKKWVSRYIISKRISELYTCV